MAPARKNTRAVADARERILAQLKDDHKRLKKAYRDFGKLDVESDAERCHEIVQQAVQELKVHAALEEEMLYPAARTAISDEDLIDEAEVEHESAHALIEQLEGMSPDDEKFAARFTVLCEYVMHHVKEEEKEMFPRLERARLDWVGLAQEMESRRAELMGTAGGPEAMNGEAAEGTEGGVIAEAGGVTAGSTAETGEDEEATEGAPSAGTGRSRKGR